MVGNGCTVSFFWAIIINGEMVAEIVIYVSNEDEHGIERVRIIMKCL